MTNIDLLIARCGEISPDLETNARTLVESYRDLGRSESTIDTYVRQLRLIASNYGSDPAGWDHDDQDAFIRHPWFKGLAKSSKDIVTSVLKAYWETLWRKDLLEHPTFFKARKARGEGRDKTTLKDLSIPQADVEAVVAECRLRIREGTDTQVYQHYSLLLQAAFGLRNVAVSHLRQCDLRFNERILHVDDDKGGKDHDVPMDVDVSQEHSIFMAARERIIGDLRARCAGQDDMVFAKLDALLAPDGPLFFKKDVSKGTAGERIDRGTVGQRNGALASRIIGRRVNPHSFRHSKVFYLFEVKGLSAHQVAKYMGHTNINTTYSYLDMDAADLHDALSTGKAVKVEAGPVTDGSDKMRALGDLYKQGVIDADAFAKAVAALK